MMTPARRGRHGGFTTIELLIVLVVIAVVIALGLPSFNALLARKRVEGVFGEFQTDLQFARSEAVSTNLPVRVTFGSACYVIHTHPTGAGATSCSPTADPTIGANARQVKSVQLQGGTTTELIPNGGLTWVQFEPLRGGAEWDGSPGFGAASINVNGGSGAWQLRAIVTALGRVSGCSPGASIKGYATCS